MSFILDSLRKSENARQENVGPSVAEIGTSGQTRSNRSMFLWLGILLGLNVVILIVSLWRPWQNEPSTPTVNQNTQTTPSRTLVNNSTTTPTPSVGSSIQSDSRPEVRPLSSEVPRPKVQRPPQTAESTSQQATQTPTKAESAPILERPGQVLPTIHELQADGELQLSNLHLDMHMYHEDPNRRFVFLNSKKYKEGERISEGPLLEEIRNDAVVFYYKGQRFLLPR